MPLIAVTSLHGAPGCTTLAIELTRRWAGSSEALLLDADPDGGCVAARAGLAGSPGLTELAASTRAGFTEAALVGASQPLHPRGRAVPAHPSPDQVHLALRTCATTVACGVAGPGRPGVIADVGRLRPGSPALPLVEGADVVAVVVDPALGSIAALRHRSGALSQLPAVLVLTPSGPYSAAEISAATGLGVVATIPRATNRSTRRQLTAAIDAMALELDRMAAARTTAGSQ